MKKLITYIFFLSIIVALVYITKESVNIWKNVAPLSQSQTEAVIKQERMLFPVVKILHVQQGFSYNASESRFIDFSAVVSSATGFSIQYNPVDDISFVITNDHFCREIILTSSLVIENYEGAQVKNSMGQTSSEVLYTDPGLDLCLVEVPGFIKPAIIADYSYKAQLFERVFIVGGPSGDFPIIIDTYVSSSIDRRTVNIGALSSAGNNFMLISEQIFPGHSGSPVFNQGGEVIGIVFASLETYGGLAISHKDIFELLYRYQNTP